MQHLSLIPFILAVSLTLSLLGCGGTSSDGEFVSKWGERGEGDGQFNLPSGIAVAPDGSIYVADQTNHRVQKILVGPKTTMLQPCP